MRKHLSELGVPVDDLLARVGQRCFDRRHVVAVHRIDVALHLQHSHSGLPGGQWSCTHTGEQPVTESLVVSVKEFSQAWERQSITGKLPSCRPDIAQLRSEQRIPGQTVRIQWSAAPEQERYKAGGQQATGAVFLGMGLSPSLHSVC